MPTDRARARIFGGPLTERLPFPYTEWFAFGSSSTNRPHRLAVQDSGLSRRQHGFESRWGHFRGILMFVDARQSPLVHSAVQTP